MLYETAIYIDLNSKPYTARKRLKFRNAYSSKSAMINFKPEPRTRSTAIATSSTSSTNSAFSFISKGWKEVRESADADLQLMKNRANSFKNLATSFDRELKNFVHSASTFSVPPISSSSPAEIDFVKKLQPKLSEIRRAYSSPDFSKKVLEKWSPRAKIGINLSAIKNAIVSEVDDEFDGGDRFWRGRSVRFKEFWGEWKGEGEGEDGTRVWEPIRSIKTRLRELERKSSSSSSAAEIFEGFKKSEFVEKVKSSLV